MVQRSIATILLISCLVACGPDPVASSVATDHGSSTATGGERQAVGHSVEDNTEPNLPTGREFKRRLALHREWLRSPEGIRSRLWYHSMGSHLSAPSRPILQLTAKPEEQLDKESWQHVTSVGVFQRNLEDLLDAYAHLRAHRFDSGWHSHYHEQIMFFLAHEYLLDMPVLVQEDRNLSPSAKRTLVDAWQAHLKSSDADEFGKAANFFAAAEPGVSRLLLVDAFVLDPTDERLSDALTAIADCWNREEGDEGDRGVDERQTTRAILVTLHDAARSDGQRQAVRSRYVEYFPEEAPR